MEVSTCGDEKSVRRNFGTYGYGLKTLPIRDLNKRV